MRTVQRLRRSFDHAQAGIDPGPLRRRGSALRLLESLMLCGASADPQRPRYANWHSPRAVLPCNVAGVGGAGPIAAPAARRFRWIDPRGCACAALPPGQTAAPRIPKCRGHRRMPVRGGAVGAVAIGARVGATRRLQPAFNTVICSTLCRAGALLASLRVKHKCGSDRGVWPHSSARSAGCAAPT